MTVHVGTCLSTNTLTAAILASAPIAVIYVSACNDLRRFGRIKLARNPMTSFFNYLRSKMKKDKNNSEEKEQYELECSFVFKGKFYIKANSEEEVIDIFRNQCNLMIGGGISTNDKERQKIVSQSRS